MTDFFDLVPQQRACRKFIDKTIDDETIEKLLNTAIRAPSAENSQPWEFIVVRDKNIKQAIGQLMREAWENGARQWSEKRLDEALLKDVHDGMQGGIIDAPVLIIVCGNTEKCMQNTLAASIYPAIQNLLLAATALGLGSTLTTIATHYQNELREILKIPDCVQAMAVIPVGYSAKKMGLSRRKGIATCTHKDLYGIPWSTVIHPHV